jgi:hypothetical protein
MDMCLKKTTWNPKHVQAIGISTSGSCDVDFLSGHVILGMSSKIIRGSSTFFFFFLEMVIIKQRDPNKDTCG